MQELMLASKGKALELKTVEEVQGHKDSKLLKVQALLVEGPHLKLVDREGSRCHDAEVREETLQALTIGLFHETDEDTIVQNTITLLAFGVLDIGPIFVVIAHLGHAVGVSLLVKKIGELSVGVGLSFENGQGSLGVRRHCERDGWCGSCSVNAQVEAQDLLGQLIL